MEPDPLSVLVIGEDNVRADIIETGLREAGHERVTVLNDVTGVANCIAEVEPDVIVIDLENPNRERLGDIFRLSRAVQRPIALFVGHSDRSSMEAAIDAGVSAYVVDGLRRERVKSILDMAISRFDAHSRLTRELEEARTELKDRKLIDRAKGILMRTRSLSEDEAYRMLRSTAMNQNRKIAEIARSLVTAADLLKR